MKKSFSLLLAFAMVFSVFAPIALAADSEKELTIEEKYQALEDAGIFAGVNADGDAALDENMTRAQAARIIALVFELDLDHAPANPTFSDVGTNHWAYDAVEAAVEAGFINGRGDGTFDPNGLVTHQELAVMLALAYENLLGFEIDADATVNAKVAPWAEQYVAFAVNNNILPALNDYTQSANRGALTYAAYQAYADFNVPDVVGIASAQPSNFNEVTVELTKALTKDQQEDAKFTVAMGSVNEKVTDVKWSNDGKTAVITLDRDFRNGTYTVTLSDVADLDEDNAKAEFRATEERVAEIQFLTPSDTLPQAREITIEFEALNQYGQKANLDGNDFRIYVSDRDVENSVRQSSDEQSFTIDTYIPDPRDDSRRPDNLLQRGQGLYIRILHEASGVAADKTFTIGDRPIISKVEFGNLINADGEEIEYIRAGKTAFLEVAAYDQYGVRINSADVLNGLEDGVNEVSVFTSDRDLHVGDGSDDGDRTPFVDGDNDGNVDLQLTAEEKLTGEVTVTAYSYGGSVTKVVEVKALRVPASVEIPRYDGILADGDTDKYIPFKAFDVNGDELTAAEIVENADEFDIRAWGGLHLARNPIKRDGNDRGKIHIEEVSGRGQAQIMVSIDRRYDTEKTINININPQREADKLEWKAEPPAAAVIGAEEKFEFLIKDQYGEDYKNDIPGDRDYDFYVKVAFDNVNVASDSYLTGPDNVTLRPGEEHIYDDLNAIHDKDLKFHAGQQVGNYRIDISLHLKDNDKQIHKLATKTVKVIDGRDSDDKLKYSISLDKLNEDGKIMAVADVAGAVYSQDANLRTVPKLLKEIKVNATDDNGNKVAIKQEITNVTSSRSSVAKGVQIDDKWYVAGIEEGRAYVTVHFNTQNGSDVAVVEVEAVDSNSKVESISFSKTNKVVKVSDLDGAYVWDANLAEKLTVRDQFNNEFVSEKDSKTETNDYAAFLNLTYSVKVTDWGDDKTGNVSINPATGQLRVDNIGSIEEFEITVTAPNGKSATFTVYVE